MGQKIFREQELKEVLSEIQKERDVHQVLLVCGESFRRQKLYETLYSTLKELGIILTEFSDFSPNPKYESVIAGNRSLQTASLRHDCDSGWWKCHGCGKMYQAVCIYGPVAKLPDSGDCGKLHSVAAIPTTAEPEVKLLSFAVIYYQGNEQSVNHTSCIPG